MKPYRYNYIHRQTNRENLFFTIKCQLINVEGIRYVATIIVKLDDSGKNHQCMLTLLKKKFDEERAYLHRFKISFHRMLIN